MNCCVKRETVTKTNSDGEGVLKVEEGRTLGSWCPRWRSWASMWCAYIGGCRVPDGIWSRWVVHPGGHVDDLWGQLLLYLHYESTTVTGYTMITNKVPGSISCKRRVLFSCPSFHHPSHHLPTPKINKRHYRFARDEYTLYLLQIYRYIQGRVAESHVSCGNQREVVLNWLK